MDYRESARLGVLTRASAALPDLEGSIDLSQSVIGRRLTEVFKRGASQARNAAKHSIAGPGLLVLGLVLVLGLGLAILGFYGLMMNRGGLR
jgi:hypothetical protein